MRREPHFPQHGMILSWGNQPALGRSSIRLHSGRSWWRGQSVRLHTAGKWAFSALQPTTQLKHFSIFWHIINVLIWWGSIICCYPSIITHCFEVVLPQFVMIISARNGFTPPDVRLDFRNTLIWWWKMWAAYCTSSRMLFNLSFLVSPFANCCSSSITAF